MKKILSSRITRFVYVNVWHLGSTARVRRKRWTRRGKPDGDFTLRVSHAQTHESGASWESDQNCSRKSRKSWKGNFCFLHTNVNLETISVDNLSFLTWAMCIIMFHPLIEQKYLCVILASILTSSFNWYLCCCLHQVRTPDMGGYATRTDMSMAVIEALRHLIWKKAGLLDQLHAPCITVNDHVVYCQCFFFFLICLFSPRV